MERKNGGQLAEASEHAMPYSLQHLLDRAPWDADTVRDDLREYIAEELGDPHGVCEFSAIWSHFVSGVMAPLGFRRNGASPFPA